MKKALTTIVSVMLVSLLLVGAVFCFTGCQNKKDDSKLYVGMECGYAQNLERGRLCKRL